MRVATKVLIGVVGLAVLIQLVPVSRDNPKVIADVAAPAEVDAILRRACYDCHSHETVWPWYAYVAPISFLVAHDVHEGREHLNFSNWGQRPRHAEDIAEVVDEGEMPMWIYVLNHPEAKLTAAERKTLTGWAKSQFGGGEHDQADDD